MLEPLLRRRLLSRYGGCGTVRKKEEGRGLQ